MHSCVKSTEQADFGMTLSLSQVVFLVLVFLCVSLWEYIMFQRNTTSYPYREGFAIFSILQWIGVFLGMVGIFGLAWGVGIGVLCMTVLQYVCHFSVRPLWNRLAMANYLVPTAIFAVTVWFVLGFGIYHFA